MVIKAFIKETLSKSWATRPFRFQVQNLITDDFLGPGFVPASPNLSSSNATNGRIQK